MTRFDSFASVLLVPLALVACNGPDTPPVVNSGLAPFSDTISPTASVNGAVYDFEAFYIELFTCPLGPDCPPPFTASGMPYFESTALQGVPMQLVDTGSPGTFIGNSVSSPAEGRWTITGAPIRPFPWYLPMALPGGTFADPSWAGSPFDPGPQVSYVPTITLWPVAANYGTCLYVGATALSESGFLQAVAVYLTDSGTPTTVADLLDPSKYGGVMAFALLQPNDPEVLAPADQTTVQVAGGTTYNIGWAPPASFPGQSDRGYFVEDGAPVSDMGISVTLFPPEAAGSMATVNFVDSVTDPDFGRPWGFMPMDLPVLPGAVIFGPLNIFPSGPPPGSNVDGPSHGPSAGWFCAP